MTSHDVVAAVRRASGEGRVGHAGTLDPAATGLLVVLVGPYTRLEPYLSAAEKSYEATIEFGEQTDTDDAEGEVTETAPVSDDIFAPEVATRILGRFEGESEQMPPAYSAIKVAGKTAHRVARAGGSIELKLRPIVVREARLLESDMDDHTWVVAFTVSKGTYVRALARDIGRAAGTVAHLEALRRISSGALSVFAAHELFTVTEAAEEGRLPELFADPVAALGLPSLIAPADVVDAGRPLESAPDAADGTRFSVLADGRLAAIYRVEGGRMLAETVFPRGPQ